MAVAAITRTTIEDVLTTTTTRHTAATTVINPPPIPTPPPAVALHLVAQTDRPSLRSNSELATHDPDKSYPKHPTMRRLNPWKAPPQFDKKSAQEQLEAWLDYHAHQFDTPNSPQHAYVARMLIDSGLTSSDVCDYQHSTHINIKWNNDTNRYDLFHFNHITLHTLPTKAFQRFPPQPTRATNTSPEIAHILGGHTGPAGNIAQILKRGRFLPSTPHFHHNIGFFAQGFRATHNHPHDYTENARILLIPGTFLKTPTPLWSPSLWGTGKKITQGGEEQAAKLLQEQHGAVFHQNGRH